MRPDLSIPIIYLHKAPVDFRKSINGLAVIVEDAMQRSPFSKELFVFTNRNHNRIKILFWEDNGFCLYYKRLEQHRFHWPKLGDNTVTLTGYQLNQLLDGHTVEPHPALYFKSMQ